MQWTNEQIEQHTQAAQKLEKIKNEVFSFISDHPATTEWETQQFVLEQFRNEHLKSYLGTPIVAFNESAANPHYFPDQRDSKKLQKNTLIMLDIWARIDEQQAPFADITWMAFYGAAIPEEMKNVYRIVIDARDTCIEFIESELKRVRPFLDKKGRTLIGREKGSVLPIGREADAAAREFIANAGFGTNFIHSTGHSIGTTSPHGRYAGLRRTNSNPLQINLGYTIEPGIYLKNKYGVRSEINFYIDSNYRLVITTPPQDKLLLI